MKAALRRQTALANAKQQQPKKKGVLDRVAGAVLRGIDRHNAAMDAAKKTGKTIAKAAQVGAKGASEFGKGVKSGVTGTVTAAKKANKVLNAGYEVDGEILDEKSVSQNQQQLAGMALKYLDGDMPDASDAVKSMAKMGRTELRKFAKTKHKGLPEVKEAIVDQPGSADNQVRDTQDDTVRRQQLKKKEELFRKQQALERQKMMLQKSGRLPMNAGYEPEGDLVDEEVPTRLFYKLQKIGKGGSSTARAQTRISSDLKRQKDEKMIRQQTKQRQEREPEEDHPSLSARERNPNLR